MSPLMKRIPREIRKGWSKYIVIFLLLVGTISLCSGFFVADESMLKAYNDSFDKYNIEDGHFMTKNPLNEAQRKNISRHVTIYDLSYVERTLSSSKIRIFKQRHTINKVDVLEGRLARKEGEIAIDRLYAKNNHLSIGNYLDNKWKIVGFVALSDYSALFENNSDSMFDAIKFGVGVVNEKTFNQLTRSQMKYCYAWKYNKKIKDEKKAADNLLKVINEETSLDDYVPRYQNQAITFTGSDMGSDRAMVMMLLYIMIIIMAFVFVVMISDTIMNEANVIGTLRATGYTIKELIFHYMSAPMIVTLISCLVGNILGYTYFKTLMASLYYNSYSLTSYKTIWSISALVETTVVPLILMIVIHYVALRRKLSLSVLKLIKRDLSKSKRKHAVYLPRHIPFFTRFRMRIIFQNIGSYIVIFVGILFANLLLLFALALPDMIHNYQDVMKSQMIADYQYILKVPSSIQSEDKLKSMISLLSYQREVETDQEAEKFSACSLKAKESGAKEEDVMVYGIHKKSRYVNIDHHGDGVYISSSYHEKYGYDKGDTIILHEPYEKKTYKLKVQGIYNYPGSVCVFMDQEKLNEDILKTGSQYFSGYFSDKPITDIKKENIATIIDFDTVTKISRQLDASMGKMMSVEQGISLVMFMVIIYLLSKVIIEKNGQSISIIKILGYSNREAAKLYILATSLVVLLSIIVSIPLEYYLLKPVFIAMMKTEMSGWIPFDINKIVYIKMFIYGVLTYTVVAIVEYKKIQRVSMSEALKNVE